MVVYFCHHLSDNYVDLTYIYVVLSYLYVDLSLIRMLQNKKLKPCSFPGNAIQIRKQLSDKSTKYLTSQHKDLTSQHHYLTSRHNIRKVNTIVCKRGFSVIMLTCHIILSTCQIMMQTCQILSSQWHCHDMKIIYLATSSEQVDIMI